ncbi:MAG TPA: SRPBCC family protein [Leucothrix mucor]|nr:SRPBCC family protein [Leucothrix mucor]
MQVTVDIEINQPKARVWAAITAVENFSKMIPSITDLKVLSQPENGIVGLKWQETRLMFGKEASETMWITEAVDNEYYYTRAENHGAIYITKMALSEATDSKSTLLTMSFTSEAQSPFVKIISAVMGVLMKRPMGKLLRKDLADIKQYVESTP